MSWNRPAPRIKVYTGENPGTPAKPHHRSVVALDSCLPDPKIVPKRSLKYRRWVASLKCMLCGKEGETQCCHADENKGMSTKTSDETCFPACVSCHAGMGAGAMFDKAERRDREAIYGARTRLQAMIEGKFPKAWL